MTNLPAKPEDLMPRLLEIALGFQASWEEHLAWWDDETAGIYNDTATFCHYLIDCYSRGETDWYPSFFTLIEDLVREGSSEMHAIAVGGLLETIQVSASHHEHGEDVFVQWLGPMSRKAWAEIDVQWSRHENLADIIRAERKEDDSSSE